MSMLDRMCSIDDENILAYAEWFGGGSDKRAVDGIVIYRHPRNRREFVVSNYSRDGVSPAIEVCLVHIFMDNDLLGAIARYKLLYDTATSNTTLLNELRMDGKEPCHG
jgi:hypothetical protein